MSDAGRDPTTSPEGIGRPNNRPVLDHLRKTQDALLERLAAVIERDYHEAFESIARSPEQRKTEVVERLLAEEPVDAFELAELDYELRACWHLGLIATGSGAQDALRRAKADLDCELLQVSRGDAVWAWLGAPREQREGDVEDALSTHGTTWGSLAIGKPRSGLAGWRRTHREAKGALAQALARPGTIVRYADGPLLAAALENDTLAMWLRDFCALASPSSTPRFAWWISRPRTLRRVILVLSETDVIAKHKRAMWAVRAATLLDDTHVLRW